MFLVYFSSSAILVLLLTGTNSSVLSNDKLKRDSLPSPVPVCVGGFSVGTNGITTCNKDASGQSRQANEV